MKINVAKNGKVQLQWHNIAFVLKKEKDIIRKGRHGRIKSLKIRVCGEVYLLTNSMTRTIYSWYSIDIPEQQKDGISKMISEYIDIL